ncbi:hypothetical protein CH063_14286, partial [Colletotrichum higginsianum]
MVCRWPPLAAATQLLRQREAHASEEIQQMGSVEGSPSRLTLDVARVCLLLLLLLLLLLHTLFLGKSGEQRCMRARIALF